MKRIFPEYAYGDGPRTGCWWDETGEVPPSPELRENLSVDVAIVGGGFTGLSAALHLALQGVSIAVLEARSMGWGASGRNGGFCCLGGGIANDREMDKRYGRAARLAFRQAEKDAVSLVAELIETYGWNVDRHSEGETVLAHRPKEMKNLIAGADAIAENYGVSAQFLDADQLRDAGMGGGPFYGAMTVPIGFGLNPRKYLAGLVGAARAAGVRLYENSPVTAMADQAGQHHLTCPAGFVTAHNVIMATNGYSSEDLPEWMAGRYMPGQSIVLVTRPLTDDELGAQGWTSQQMSYDTRKLLHYFRLMPDRRILFGMRGALFSGPRAETAARAKTRADFERMFPMWSNVESQHSWSGMVSLARNKLPFVGAVPSQRGLFAAMCYHGNGVAMGSYCGKAVADLVLRGAAAEYPDAMREPLARFPMGYARRALMPPLYAGLMLQDRL